MKFRILPLFALALALQLAPAIDQYYINNALVLCPPQIPPQINAFNFINNNTFTIDSLLLTQPYATANTRTYTNNGVMSSGSGFSFMNFPDTGGPVISDFFYNPGVINSGASNVFFSSLSAPQTRIQARRVLIPGTINLGASSLLSITGDHLNLTRASLQMGGFNDGFFSSAIDGMFDGYWGANRVKFNPYSYFAFPPPYTPPHWVTNRAYLSYQTTVFPVAPQEYSVGYSGIPGLQSNIFWFGVAVRQNVPGITNRAFVDPYSQTLSVSWEWPGTNSVTGAPMTNAFYLWDNLLNITNLIVTRNGTAGLSATYRPTNYYFTYFPMGGLQMATNALSRIFDQDSNKTMTNDCTAYEVFFEPNTVIPNEIYGQGPQRLPGRVELTATNTLDLTLARVSANNYALLRCTNHFISTSDALVSAPFVDLDLATTNGTLIISNLVAPSIARPTGPIEVFSTTWSYTAADGYTNTYLILFVDSYVSPYSAPESVNVTLRSTNVFLSDYLNIQSNLLITAKNFTIATNSAAAANPAGSVTLQPFDVYIPSVFPLLENLTNYGSISVSNAAFFGGARNPPWVPTPVSEPYKSMVNRGTINSAGLTLWARQFVNSGILNAGVGNIQIISTNADLRGSFMSAGGDVSFSASGFLRASNLVLTAGRSLTLSAISQLDDGSLFAPVAAMSNLNTWQVGRGFNLPILPTQSSLLGTTITSTAPAFVSIPSTWAGRDLGASADGYVNNAAVGRLVLVGGTNCSFAFTGTGVSNAIYVDRLELEGYAAQRNANGDVAALNIASNMRIYYADVLANGISLAEKLNHKNGDRLRWVGSYAGFYTSTNIVYPDGTTNAVNTGLAASCNIDSDNDGLVNCIDPTPVFVVSQVGFAATLGPQVQPTVLLSWNTIGGARNVVRSTPTLSPPSWTVLTNFVSGPLNGRLTLPLPALPGNRFYRVSVEPVQP